MKKIIFILAVSCLVVTSYAQKNATKIRYSPVPSINTYFFNIGPFMKLFSGVISLSQERKLNDRLSIQATLRYLPNKTGGILDYITEVEYKDEDYNPFINPTFSGLGTFIDLKIYGKDKGAMNGFYWGPYLHAMTYTLQSERDYLEAYDDNGVLYFGEAQTKYKMSNMGLGLQIGTQKIFDNGITIDWTILGIGLNGVKVSGEVDVKNTSDNFDFRNYEDEINADTDFFINNSNLEVNKESVRLSSDRYYSTRKFYDDNGFDGSNLPFLNFRMGISIGFGYGNK